MRLALRRRYLDEFRRSMKPFRWPLLAGVVILALSFSTACWFSGPYWEISSVKLAGLGLQLMGLVTVALGLSKSRKLFKKRGFLAAVCWRAKLFKNIFFPPDPVPIVATGALAPITLRFEGEGRAETTQEKTIDERVEALERALSEAIKGIDSLGKELTETEGRIKRMLSNEERERSKVYEGLRAKLEETAIGGIHLEFSGVVVLAVGAVLATFPELLAGRIPCLV